MALCAVCRWTQTHSYLCNRAVKWERRIKIRLNFMQPSVKSLCFFVKEFTSRRLSSSFLSLLLYLFIYEMWWDKISFAFYSTVSLGPSGSWHTVGIYNEYWTNEHTHLSITHISIYILLEVLKVLWEQLSLLKSKFKYINVMCYFQKFHYESFYDRNNLLQFILLIVCVGMLQLCLCQGTGVNISHFK